jgi:hypothetical protein
MKPIERLKEMGFVKCGRWTLEAEELKYYSEKDIEALNVLYAFVSMEIILYIGKTIRSLKKRMYGYQNPGPTQLTNLRNNKNMKELLKTGVPIDIHAFADNGLFSYGGFHANLAAGLEDSIIEALKPKWNIFRAGESLIMESLAPPDTETQVNILRSENIQLKEKLKSLERSS